jgi:hypothetical protein
VRSTDNDYDNDNLTTMYETSDSVQACAEACDADTECVAFDYGPEGYCYAYKHDPLAPYVGNGSDADWSCYHKISIPTGCDASHVTTIVNLNIQITTL